jgi:hypothetical protein
MRAPPPIEVAILDELEALREATAELNAETSST